MAKGQAAIEYLALVGFVLLLAVPLMTQVQTSANDLRTSADFVTAREALNKIEEGAALVHSQGEPARITFDITIPGGIKYSNVSNTYLHFKMDESYGGADLYADLEFNVTGSIPVDRGRHTMVAEAVGRSNVSIHEK